MNGILDRDFVIKIASILFAVFLWIYVLGSSNPVKIVYITVPLKVINEDTLQEKGFALKKDYQRSVSLGIKGRTEKVNVLNPDDFVATVDFSKVKSVDDKQLAIEGPFYKGKGFITIDEVSPKTISIDVGKLQTNSFNVEVVPTGNLKANYKIIKTTATPNAVSVQDFDSVIANIKSVKAFVDVTNLDRDTIVRKECKVYNKNGEEILNLGKNLIADVKIEVAKEVSVSTQIRGKVNPDYFETSRKITPEKVLISGPSDQLAQIDSIVTDLLDIENIKDNINTQRAFKLPANISIANGSQKEATILVTLEKYQKRDLIFEKTQINLLNIKDTQFKYEIIPATITLTVVGKKSDVDLLDIKLLKPEINIEKQEEGTQKLPMNVVLPENIKIVQPTTVEVKIVKASVGT